MDTLQILMLAAGCWNLFLAVRALRSGSWRFGSNVYSRAAVPAGFWFFTVCVSGAGMMLLLSPFFLR
jgi:hypothetical protein